jgi:hypothetical protein
MANLLRLILRAALELQEPSNKLLGILRGLRLRGGREQRTGFHEMPSLKLIYIGELTTERS